MNNLKELLDRSFTFDEKRAREFYRLCYGESVGLKKDHVIACMENEQAHIAPLARAVIGRLVEALKFYAERCPEIHPHTRQTDLMLLKRLSIRAQEALAEVRCLLSGEGAGTGSGG